MINIIEIGDTVIVKQPSHKLTSVAVVVIALDGNLATCFYLTIDRAPVSFSVPTAWLELPKPKPKIGGGSVGVI